MTKAMLSYDKRIRKVERDIKKLKAQKGSIDRQLWWKEDYLKSIYKEKQQFEWKRALKDIEEEIRVDNDCLKYQLDDEYECCCPRCVKERKEEREAKRLEREAKKQDREMKKQQREAKSRAKKQAREAKELEHWRDRWVGTGNIVPKQEAPEPEGGR